MVETPELQVAAQSFDPQLASNKTYMTNLNQNFNQALQNPSMLRMGDDNSNDAVNNLMLRSLNDSLKDPSVGQVFNNSVHQVINTPTGSYDTANFKVPDSISNRSGSNASSVASIVHSSTPDEIASVQNKLGSDISTMNSVYYSETHSGASSHASMSSNAYTSYVSNATVSLSSTANSSLNASQASRISSSSYQIYSVAPASLNLTPINMPNASSVSSKLGISTRMASDTSTSGSAGMFGSTTGPDYDDTSIKWAVLSNELTNYVNSVTPGVFSSASNSSNNASTSFLNAAYQNANNTNGNNQNIGNLFKNSSNNNSGSGSSNSSLVSGSSFPISVINVTPGQSVAGGSNSSSGTNYATSATSQTLNRQHETGKNVPLYANKITAKKKVDKNGKTHYIFELDAKTRGDIDQGKFGGKNVISSGAHTQRISRKTLNKILEANGLQSLSDDLINKAISSGTPLINANDNIAFNASVKSTSDIHTNIVDTRSISSSSVPFDGASEQKLEQQKFPKKTKAKTKKSSTKKASKKSKPKSKAKIKKPVKSTGREL